MKKKNKVLGGLYIGVGGVLGGGLIMFLGICEYGIL